MSAPISPPIDWFFQPEPDGPQPLRFDTDGRVSGHLAIWGSCHTGFLNGALAECVRPPQSKTDYQQFHLGTVLTEEGEEVQVGKLTFDTSHAPIHVGMQAAARHYDHTGSVGAYLRAVDGKHGIWTSGAVRSNVPEEGVRDMRANPPSGDWRAYNGALELVAALSVPVPGFPIVKPQFALAASADGTPEVESLILPAWTVEEDLGMVASVDYQERKQALSDELLERAEWDRTQLRRRRAITASLSE